MERALDENVPEFIITDPRFLRRCVRLRNNIQGRVVRYGYHVLFLVGCNRVYVLLTAAVEEVAKAAKAAKSVPTAKAAKAAPTAKEAQAVKGKGRVSPDEVDAVVKAKLQPRSRVRATRRATEQAGPSRPTPASEDEEDEVEDAPVGEPEVAVPEQVLPMAMGGVPGESFRAFRAYVEPISTYIP